MILHHCSNFPTSSSVYYIAPYLFCCNHRRLFYTEMENANQLGCANDVAKEIIKLKKENIEGLILDLRFNGGGSITEAMDLAGIFIDEGPLAIAHYRDSKPIALKDMNRGTIFNGPLLIMVNSGVLQPLNCLLHHCRTITGL